MTRRPRSVMITHQENPMLGINLCGYEADRQSVVAEIAAAEAILARQPANSLLVVIDLAFTEMMPEIVSFIQAHSGQAGDPIRKMAVVGVSSTRRFWYRLRKTITWPRHARFFDEHEKAKAWLISEYA